MCQSTLLLCKQNASHLRSSVCLHERNNAVCWGLGLVCHWAEPRIFRSKSTVNIVRGIGSADVYTIWTLGMYFMFLHYFNIIIKYKTKKYLFLINILIFNFLYFLHISKPRVRLQEAGCTCKYVIVCCTCISISVLVCRRVCVQPHIYLQDFLYWCM